MTSKTTLYRIYGEKAVLLYVGITGDLDKRLRQHSEKAWWTEVRKIDSIDYATRAAAMEAETRAIKTEHPRYNRAQSVTKLPTPAIPQPNVAPSKRVLISLDVAATEWSVSTSLIRRMIAAGKLTGYRIGPRIIRIDRNELETAFTIVQTAVSPTEKVGTAYRAGARS